MIHIALEMLFGDRAKLIAIVIGVTFAALIMTQQPSIFVGLIMRTYAFLDDVPMPDVWVMDPGVDYVEEHKPLRETALGRVRGVDGVAWAVPMYKNLQTARLPDGQLKAINLTGVDDTSMIGGPPKVVAGSLGDLRRADGVILDVEAARRRLAWRDAEGVLHPLNIGDEFELNDRRAVVVAIAETSPDFILLPKVFTTYSRALDYAPRQARQLTYILVKAKEGEAPADLARRISAATGLKALTAYDFRWLTIGYWMRNTGIPINFGISVMLGFLVGAAVAGQSFFNFVRENLGQYAALKAMGLRNGVLVRMVLVQALVAGGIGYGMGVGLSAAFGTAMRGTVLAFAMRPELLAFSFAGVLLIVSVAALLGIRQVVQLDPAVVFRS
jgi:putative ABC transport system permease protein